MRWTLALTLATLLSGCAIVQPGEVGVKRRLGALGDKIHAPGPVWVTPGIARVMRVPVRTSNLEVKLALPSQEGLNVRSEVSILYRVDADRVRDVLMEVGEDYEQTLILSTFRSAAADVSARFVAKDMHTAKRATFEAEVKDRMMEVVSPRGFVIEAVLLKSIQLPDGLARAVEEKLEAEQAAQRMEFVLERERLEAERRVIEAEGMRDAQLTIAEAIDDRVLQWNRIEAFRALSTSPNTKIVVTGGNDTPLLIDLDDEAAAP